MQPNLNSATSWRRPRASLLIVSTFVRNSGVLLGLAVTLDWSSPPADLRAQEAGGSHAARPALVWRNIGPARPGGHVTDVSGVDPRSTREPEEAAPIFVAGPGGLFRTIDEGATWEPMFDEEAVAAVSAVAVAPSDPRVVWVGTGYANIWEGVGFHIPVRGRGVYRSRDGGERWSEVGLAFGESISRIAIHPRDANTAYVAVAGSLTRESEQRGIYKTTDGGRSWRRVLFVNGWTGGEDLAIDPTNPSVVYATMQQRALSGVGLSLRGPGSGVFKSTDGGETWRRIMKGLPVGHLGRCTIAVSASNPSIFYAVVQYTARDSLMPPDRSEWYALYRSDDGGESWTRRTTPPAASFREDFGRIAVDPLDPDRIYVATQALSVSEDGGRTFRIVADLYPDGAPDPHAIWINPVDPSHIVIGTDRGVHFSSDRGETWRHSESLVMAEVFSVAVDQGRPFYTVYASSRDHHGYGIPSGSRSRLGIRNGSLVDLPLVPECCGITVDPADSTVFGGGTGLVRHHVPTGLMAKIGPHLRAGNAPESSSGFAPVVISPHDRTVVYLGTSRVYESRNRGDTWRPLGRGFSTSGPDSVTLAGTRVKAFTALDAVSALDVARTERGVLWAGTPAGKLYVTRDGGSSWQEVTPPALSCGAVITQVTASRHGRGQAYVVANAIQRGDQRPLAFVTSDYGGRWETIAGDLPEARAVWTIAEHQRTPGALFVGTDAGVFYSVDGGKHWTSARYNMPAVRVTSLIIQPDANDLVAGTWGRGVWVLDDIGPLEGMAQAQGANAVTLYPVRPSVRHFRDHPSAVEVPEYAAPNPPYGAPISYYVPADIALDRGWIEIRDTAAALVRRLPASLSPGLHRVIWDLRRQPPLDRKPTGMEPMRFANSYGAIPPGAPVRTGSYDVQVVGDTIRELSDDRIRSAIHVVQVLPDPQLPPAEQDASVQVLAEATDALRRLETLIDSAEALRDRIGRRLVGATDRERHRLTRATAQLDSVLLALRGTGDVRRDWHTAWPANLVLLFRTGIYEYTHLPVSVQRGAMEDVLQRMIRAREMVEDVRNVVGGAGDT